MSLDVCFSSPVSPLLMSLWMVLCFLRPLTLLQAFDHSKCNAAGRLSISGVAMVCRKPRLPNVLLGLYMNSMNGTMCAWELLDLLSVVTSCYRGCAWGRGRGVVMSKLCKALDWKLDWRKWLCKCLSETFSSPCPPDRKSTRLNSSH